MENIIKKRLIVFIFILLLLPMLQQEFRFVPQSVEPREELYREFNWNDWWNGFFWDHRSRYLNDEVGFRKQMVQINNQLDYSLFEKFKSRSLVIGAHHCLFYKEFIFPYYGMGFLGRESIAGQLRMMKALQDTLGHLGKSFVFVQAPCKVSFYPEYVPPEFATLRHGPNNYDVYTALADSMGINHIDFNKWFISMKKTSRELLFTRESIHWSMYGSLLAADSLVSYLEQLRHVKMPHPHWDKIEHTRKARYMDNDITQAMDLALPATDDVYSYPVVTWKDDSATRPRAIYIGDSFMFNWVYSGFPDQEHINWQFWFYFKEIWDRYSKGERMQHKPISGFDWVSEMNRADLVIILYTSANDYHIGDTFIKRAYEHFYPSGQPSKQFTDNWN